MFCHANVVLPFVSIMSRALGSLSLTLSSQEWLLKALITHFAQQRKNQRTFLVFSPRPLLMLSDAMEQMVSLQKQVCHLSF